MEFVISTVLPLLRKVRKSLIGSSSLKKYTLYALGEIALVVLGILVALQINNWNEARKAANVEREYLIALEKEFNSNKEQLNQFISLVDRLVITAKDILKHTGTKGSETISESRLNYLFIELIRESVEYEPSPGILEDLISSGSLNKLTNTELRKQLSNWKAQLAKVRRQENTVLEYRSNIKNLLIEKGNTRNPIYNLLQIDESDFNTLNVSLLEEPLLENNLSLFTISSSGLNNEYYGILSNLIDDILITIKKQMENG